jgi:curli production assembly/transport component CsgF
MRTKPTSCFWAALLIFAASAQAQDLIYTPVNPSFGGSGFNSGHLLGVAGAQKPEKKAAARAEQSASEMFLKQLQSRLLSALAGQVTDAIFGDSPQEDGTVSFGNQIVTFHRGLDSVLLTVVDIAAGTTTEIEIPILQTP